MKRLVIFGVAAGAAVAVSAAPAVAGLIGNASFSRQIPVQIPSGATPAQLADDRGDRGPSSTSSAGVDRPQAPRSEVVDRHGSPATTAEPGDDNGGLGSDRPAEPGDDRGRGGTPTPTASTSTSDEHHRGGPSSTPTSGSSSGRGGGDQSQRSESQGSKSQGSNRGPGSGSDG